MDDKALEPGPGTDFIRQIVAADLRSGRYGGRVVTRFPPEPNGYMHIGHAKSVVLNFGIAREFGGRCHLRFDDTNPETENEAFVRQFQDDIRWLGYDWGEHLYFASDYFERMYECAETLIRKGLAYVDSQTTEEIRVGRGTVTEPGVAGPYRDRPVEENLELFRRMRGGEFPDGAHVLRAKIDLASPNMLMRDPVLYRIRHAHHYRQGSAWCLYPLYDYAHCLEDAFEGVTHSICTLEFENNRELYDWVLDGVGFSEPRPHQYEFARLELEHAVLSKRRIAPLVGAGAVAGWDDPRLATVAGMRRRGVPPEALRLFCEMIGVAKTNSTVDADKLSYAIRESLNPVAPRVMAVLDPLKVVITNFPEGETERIIAPYYPHDVPRVGSRIVPFTRELFIERADFSDDPPAGFRRLVKGGEVRLRYAYVIRCDEVVRDADGRVVELRCSRDPKTKGGDAPAGRRVQGTIQWVSAHHALEAEVRLYDHLFREAEVASDLGDEADILGLLNPESLVVVQGAKIEPSVATDPVDTRYQFERTGYFWRDPVDGAGEALVFNRIVRLKDSSWRKAHEEGESAASARPSVTVSVGRTHQGSVGGLRPGTRPQVSVAREGLRERDPELASRFERYREGLGLPLEHADLLTGSREVAGFFEEALSVYQDAPVVAAWVVVDLRGLLGRDEVGGLPFTGAALGRLAAMVAEERVSRRAAKDVLARMVAEGGDPERLVGEMGLAQVTDGDQLREVADRVLAAWPDKVVAYREGKTSLMGMFIGEVMKVTGGAADPRAAKEILQERLEQERLHG